MAVVKLLLLGGMFAVFYPYTGSGSRAESGGGSRREKSVYLVMAGVGLSLGGLYQFGMYPKIANWIDEVMDLVFRMMGGSPV